MNNIFISFVFIFTTCSLSAGNSLDNFVKSDLLQNATISLLIKDVNTGATLQQYRSKSATIPASIMKVVTTATALEILGSDFRFKTTLGIDGEINKDGVLNGNLYIVGGGDPTLGSYRIGDPNFLKLWVIAIKSAGIKKITGRIIPDATFFDNEGVSPYWTWEDIGNYYAAGAYGIACYDNTLRLFLQSGKVGTTPAILKVIPEIPTLVIDNQLISSLIGSDSAYFYGAPMVNARTLRGEIPANKSEFIIKGDIPNPGMVLAQKFHDELKMSGIDIANSPTDKLARISIIKTVYTYQSPALSKIIEETNMQSNNLYAEHVFRYLGARVKGVSTSTAAINTIRSFWSSKGLDTDQLFMRDGCGLSPSNAVSAAFFVDLLSYMYTKSKNKDVFYNSLPVSGVSGTLKSFLSKTPLQGNVHAKSGTISRVKCYSGYIEKNNKTYVFTIMVNNANGRSSEVNKAIEGLLLSL